MTISKEQIEAALKHMRQFAFEQHNGCEYYIPFLDIETVITVLKERLATYDQLNENDSQLNTPSEAMADLDVSISFLKQILPYEIGGDVAKHLDIIFEAALQRNDVPQGLNTKETWDEVREHFKFLWDEYALCPNDKLTEDAIDLKNKLIYLASDAAPKPTGVTNE